MTDQEEQEDELLALTSIYDEEILTLAKEGDGRGGQLLVYCHLPDHFIIKAAVKETKKNEENSVEIKEEKSHEIKYLPPLSLSFQLPSDYPSCSPPNFTLACKWLNRKQLTKLCKKLDYAWDENQGSVVLFMWANFLQGELFQFLDISSPLELATVIALRKDSSGLDPRAIQEVASQELLLPAILEYDKQMKKREFDRSIFTCKVCFSDVVGAKCISFLGCGHIYCSDCMGDYFSVQIQEANVKGLECPEDKCESQAHPSQVKQLVSPELFAKYEKLLLQTCLDTMVDVIYCPRPACQCPILLDRESNMSACPDCRLVFCTLCLFTYHGLSPCRLKADGIKKLKEEYEKGDQATRRLLEKRYGRATIKQALEESFSQEWLEKFSKQCPSCGSYIQAYSQIVHHRFSGLCTLTPLGLQNTFGVSAPPKHCLGGWQKIDGCNKMICMKCRAYFCWICMALLSNSNPYKHYNTEESDCFNRLFEGVEIDDFDEDDDDWWN